MVQFAYQDKGNTNLGNKKLAGGKVQQVQRGNSDTPVCLKTKNVSRDAYLSIF